MKANYHTHTTRCHHAQGEDEAYVQAALRAGFDALGFSDHTPWPFQSGYVSGIRMGMEDLPGYIASIQSLKERYAGQLQIHIGLECEYFPRYHDHLLRMREMGVEYFILGQHFTDSEEDTPYTARECKKDDGVLRYGESTANAIRTGLFRYVAHPDLFMRHRAEDWTPACVQAADMICQAVWEMRIPLEYNLAGLENQHDGQDCGYPSDCFWRYARKWGCSAILGVDAHSPALLENTALWQEGRQYLQALGYTVLDHLDIQ